MCGIKKLDSQSFFFGPHLKGEARNDGMRINASW